MMRGACKMRLQKKEAYKRKAQVKALAMIRHYEFTKEEKKKEKEKAATA